MNGNKVVLDSNLLIFLSKGMINREKLQSKYDEFCVSIVTYINTFAKIMVANLFVEVVFIGFLNSTKTSDIIKIGSAFPRSLFNYCQIISRFGISFVFNNADF